MKMSNVLCFIAGAVSGAAAAAAYNFKRSEERFYAALRDIEEYDLILVRYDDLFDGLDMDVAGVWDQLENCDPTMCGYLTNLKIVKIMGRYVYAANYSLRYDHGLEGFIDLDPYFDKVIRTKGYEQRVENGVYSGK